MASKKAVITTKENTKSVPVTSFMEVVGMKMAEDVQAPKFPEDKRIGIIRYGKDNLYPDFLLDLFINKSNKHNSIITRKVAMTTGNGFEETSDSNLNAFIDNTRGSHPLEDMVQLLDTDYRVFNAFAFLVRWNADKTSPAAIDYVPVHKVRKGLIDNTFWVSDDWQHYRKPESNTVMYRALDDEPVAAESSDDQRRLGLVQMVYFGELTIGADFYPHVPYQSAINYILADFAISRFTINNIHNNFVGGYHIAFRGAIPEPDERRKIKAAFKKEYTGEEAESIVMTWNEEEGEGTKITALPTAGNENAFLQVEDQVRQNIFIAHGVTNPLLFGVMVPGSLGGRDELQESLEIFQITNITPHQVNLENALNRVAELAGISSPLVLEKYTFVDRTETADGVLGEDAENVADTAMNGAQVAALIQIIESIQTGALSPESAIQVIMVAFPTISIEQAQKIVGNAEPTQTI